jgi:hypothetical protein
VSALNRASVSDGALVYGVPGDANDDTSVFDKLVRSGGERRVDIFGCLWAFSTSIDKRGQRVMEGR